MYCINYISLNSNLKVLEYNSIRKSYQLVSLNGSTRSTPEKKVMDHHLKLTQSLVSPLMDYCHPQLRYFNGVVN